MSIKHIRVLEISPNLTAPASVQNPNELCRHLAVTREHSGENRHASSGVQKDEHCGGTVRHVSIFTSGWFRHFGGRL